MHMDWESLPHLTDRRKWFFNPEIWWWGLITLIKTARYKQLNLYSISTMLLEPLPWAGYRDKAIFPWAHMRNFSPVSETKKRPNTRATSSSAKFEKQSKHGETESQNFCAYHSFGDSSRCITAVKWDAYNVKNTTGKARRYHPGR